MQLAGGKRERPPMNPGNSFSSKTLVRHVHPDRLGSQIDVPEYKETAYDASVGHRGSCAAAGRRRLLRPWPVVLRRGLSWRDHRGRPYRL